MITPTALFKLLADETRLRCLLLLTRHAELCVCELAHALEAAQPKISRHLAMLRNSGAALDRKEGLWVHYRLHPELPAWALRIIHSAAEGCDATAPFREDAQRLEAMPDRPNRCGAATGHPPPAGARNIDSAKKTDSARSTCSARETGPAKETGPD